MIVGQYNRFDLDLVFWIEIVGFQTTTTQPQITTKPTETELVKRNMASPSNPIDSGVSVTASDINVNLPHLGLGDEVVGFIMMGVEKAALANTTFSNAPASTGVNLVLEMNYFTSAGIHEILRKFLAWQTSPLAPLRALVLKRLRTHMCRVCDEGALHISAYMKACSTSAYLPSEVHLSHNRLTSKGALALIESASTLYPRILENKQAVPLWLRLEYNAVDSSAVSSQVRNSVRVCTCLRAVGAEVGNGSGGRGGWRGRGGKPPGLKCCTALCIRNVALMAQEKKTLSSDAVSGSLSQRIPFTQVHLPFFKEQRPLGMALGVSISTLKSFCGRQTRSGTSSGKPTALSFPAPHKQDSVHRQQKPMQDSSESVKHELGAAAASLSVHTMYLVLDTSAVMRMCSTQASRGHFTFASLGLKQGGPIPVGCDGSLVLVLLETVLQQLDNQKSKAGCGHLVNGFMRLYPELQEQGVLVRLLSEDAEDVVRSGGANVCTRPGCRLPDGKFDSDGVIIDSSLVLQRALSSGDATAPLQQSPAVVVLLTADIYMRNRAQEVGQSSVLWDAIEMNWARQQQQHGNEDGFSLQFNSSSIMSALPKDLTCAIASTPGSQALAHPTPPTSTPLPAVAHFATGLTESVQIDEPGRLRPSGVGGMLSPLSSTSARLPHVELLDASHTTLSLISIIQSLCRELSEESDHSTEQRNTILTRDSLLREAQTACAAGGKKAELWAAMHAKKLAVSSLHTVIYKSNSSSDNKSSFTFSKDLNHHQQQQQHQQQAQQPLKQRSQRGGGKVEAVEYESFPQGPSSSKAPLDKAAALDKEIEIELKQRKEANQVPNLEQQQKQKLNRKERRNLAHGRPLDWTSEEAARRTEETGEKERLLRSISEKECKERRGAALHGFYDGGPTSGGEELELGGEGEVAGLAELIPAATWLEGIGGGLEESFISLSLSDK